MKAEPSLQYEQDVIAVVSDVAQRHEDIHDDLQQVGRMAVLEALKSYEQGRGMSERSWVIQQVRRDVIREIGKEDRETLAHTDIDPLIDMDDVEQLIDFDEQNTIVDQIVVWRALSMIDAEDAQILEDRYINDQTYQEIGERLGLTPAGTKWRIEQLLEKIIQEIT